MVYMEYGGSHGAVGSSWRKGWTRAGSEGAWDVMKKLCTVQYSVPARGEGKPCEGNLMSYGMFTFSIYSVSAPVLLTLKHKTKDQIHHHTGN